MLLARVHGELALPAGARGDDRRARARQPWCENPGGRPLASARSGRPLALGLRGRRAGPGVIHGHATRRAAPTERAARRPVAGRRAPSPRSAAAVRWRRSVALALVVVVAADPVPESTGRPRAPPAARRGPARRRRRIPPPTPLPENDKQAAVASVLAYTPFIKEGTARKPEVALTFDDGPGPLYARRAERAGALRGARDVLHHRTHAPVLRRIGQAGGARRGRARGPHRDPSRDGRAVSARPVRTALRTGRPGGTAGGAPPGSVPPAVRLLQRDHDRPAAAAEHADGAVVGGHRRLRAAGRGRDRPAGAGRSNTSPRFVITYCFCGDAYNSGTFDETACLSAMVTTAKAPLSLQISSSWSWLPADPSTDDPYYQQMAAQGQSFFDAVGDSGAWASGGFAYPGDDIYVIGVGGTELQTNGAGGSWKSEISWPDSGGGINFDGIAIPSYQQLTGVITTQNKGSKTLRNGPDVAAEANFDFYVCHKGKCGNGWGGTSFAAPMMAGYLALANQQAVSSGDPAPGFINPAIYPLGLSAGYAAAFHDITSGSNGFPAVAGYDLNTGWGSPNGAGLINALVVGGGGGPAISFTPTSLKFGKVAVHTTVGKKKVVVTNTGSGTLNISSIAITGDFALVPVKATKKITPCVNGTALAAGATCEIKVSFTPTQTGTRTGAVNFTDNASGSPQSVGLTGTGK